jgi:hypothetical protein
MAKVTSTLFSKAFSSITGMTLPTRNPIEEQLQLAVSHSSFCLPFGDIGDYIIIEDKLRVIGDAIHPRPSTKLRRILDQSPDMLFILFDEMLPLKDGIFISGYLSPEENKEMIMNNNITDIHIMNKGITTSNIKNFVGGSI